MIEDNTVIFELKQMIKSNPESFNFIAQFSEINLFSSDIGNYDVEFGKYHSKLQNSIPFYKQISKIIDPTLMQQ